MDQQHPLLPVQREDGDRARVVQVLPAHDTGLAEVEGVADDVPDHPVEQLFAAVDRSLRERVAQLAVGLRTHALAAAWTSTSTSRSARCRASAAPTRPANSGWAASGRERNSGCAWVPT